MADLDMLYATPAPGLVVLGADNAPMPAEGMAIHPHDPHWAQLLKFGDIVLTEPPAAVSPEPPPSDAATA